MFSPFERLVAMRYLRPRKQEGFISVIAWFSLVGIALGVATLIIVMSVMNGFRQEMFSIILGLNGHVAVVGSQGPIENYDQAADKIVRIPGVVSVTPTVEAQVMAMSGQHTTGALVRGITAEDFAAHDMLASNIFAGELEDFRNRNAVIIGEQLARRMGLSPGDKLTIVSPQTSTTVMGAIPRTGTFTVAATFKVGMFEYDNSFVYMPLDMAQKFFSTGEGVTKLEVTIRDPDKSAAVGRRIAEQNIEGAYVTDWQRQNATFFAALKTERNVMFIILTLIVLVAAFNIISGLIMLVKDKGRDIAILRTMGATSGSVMRIFLMSGASVGVVGTLAGLALGVVITDNLPGIQGLLENLTGARLFAEEIYFLSSLPAQIDWTEVAWVVAMGLALSFLATVYPSWRAARLDPVEALRYE